MDDTRNIDIEDAIVGDETTGAEMRQCIGTETVKGCSEWKPLAAFKADYNKQYDRTYHRHTCIDCEAPYHREKANEYYTKTARVIKTITIIKDTDGNIISKQCAPSRKSNGKMTTCGKILPIENFPKHGNGYRGQCRDCKAIDMKNYNEKHNILPEVKENKANNRRRKYHEIDKYDPQYMIKVSFSRRIAIALKQQGSSKNDKSINEFLPYTMAELCNHIENQFESWMTWENHGQYKSKSWDDNDQSTWMWNIDHIIPHSDLPYTSMEDENFQKCWALDNLRPYSAKQNIIDGVFRIRHKTKQNDNGINNG